MSRAMVDFGIDLGTTNSAIAVLRGVEVEIIKNNEGFEYTPSTVYIDKNGALVVGRRAKERLETDPNNAYAEFKLQMGTDAEYVFARNGRTLKPEDLSAEVLKSLKADVRQRLGEEVTAGVITVPAAFELPQCKATNDAAQLAGITFSPLLQEPVAAALAHGFQSQSDKVFWLVYDFGGGTFDAAVIQVRDGVIQVINHGGDNHLGGKQIDWAIVEQLLIPELTRERPLTDFRRGNPKWGKAIAKLKQAAEQAKIRLSRDETTEVSIESLCLDDRSDAVDFECELRRADVERMAKPFILRSINICQQVLSERRLEADNIEKVLLVGGPSLMPYLRAHLEDRREGLGIPIDFSIDPLTVVARGAAIFAGTQRDESLPVKPLSAGQYRLELDYQPVGTDQEVMLGGKIATADEQDFSEYTIEFVNAEARPQWRSGKVPLMPNGTFMTNLWAELGKQNVFLIELSDATGNKLETSPDSLTYNFGMVITDPILIHSVGLALANNEVKMFLEKGTPLPAKKRFVQELAMRVKIGQADAMIKIPVVEGEHKKADRNKLIGYLEIPATELKFDLLPGTEIEVVIDIDRNRLVHTEAYVDKLDKAYKTVLTMEKKVPDAEEMAKDLEQEKKRLAEVKGKAMATGNSKAAPILERIEGERMLEEVESTLDAAHEDRDAADKCQNRLLSLKASVDQLEDVLTVPRVLAEAEEMIEWTQYVVNHLGKAADQRKFEEMYHELKAAMEARVPNIVELNRKIDQMDDLRMRILMARNEWWIDYLARLQEQRHTMTNQALAEQLFEQAMIAIEKNMIEEIKGACRQLMQLLPVRQQQTIGRFNSSVK
ncbi:MAG: Hsp70 family protein [Pyrinomonadaceae bacterium]|nr:Hsp70 family protein [Pyrinomonadaceae bacterium]